MAEILSVNDSARPHAEDRPPPCWRSVCIIVSGGSTKSSIPKAHTASILANVFDSIEISTERAVEFSRCSRTHAPTPLKLTRQQQGVRQRSKASHQERTENRMETGGLRKRQVCVSKPNLNHQPRNGSPAPRFRGVGR